jgi:hypothetical protein
MKRSTISFAEIPKFGFLTEKDLTARISVLALKCGYDILQNITNRRPTETASCEVV